jgi:predicted KAP-like P-loop ATPase
VDNETDQDLLGFQVHADLIRSIITDKSLLPTTIGVFGDWGGGKTSVMKMLQRDLDPDKYSEGAPERKQYERVACLYFNGWLFEGYDDAKSALLSSVLLQLSEHQRFGSKIKSKVGTLLLSVDWMRLAKITFVNFALPMATAAITGGSGLLPALISAGKNLLPIQPSEKDSAGLPAKLQTVEFPEGIGELIKKPLETDVADCVRSFRDRFEKLLKETDIDNLVVLIDDLDRCSPDRIIQNLEAIKLFLNVPGSAFIIGADPRIVRHAVATVFPSIEIQKTADASSRTDIINDYLEKVIQIPYTLPRLSPAEVESYMSLLFCQKYLTTKDFIKVISEAKKFRNENRYSIFGKGAIESIADITINDELEESLVFCNQGAPLITEGLKGNPRQIKRFLNAYWLRSRLANIAKLTEVKDSILVKLMILEYTRPRHFEQLFTWQSTQHGTPSEIIEMESAFNGDNDKAPKKIEGINAEWSNAYIIQWLQIEPRLSSIDLRDYFWVARDKLRTTLSGISMVPPLVRKAFEDIISKDRLREVTSLETIQLFDEIELGHLFGLLERRIVTEPDELSSFEALEKLCRKKVPQSAQVLAKVLEDVPADKLNPSLGIILLELVGVDSDIGESLGRAINTLRTSNTRIAAALQPRKKAGR